MSLSALEKARTIAHKVTENLGGLGLFGVELFIKGDQVWFSEVSPRPHDTGMVTMASQTQSEFELHAKAILGLPINTHLHSPAASAVIYGKHHAKGVTFAGVQEALSIPNTDLRLFGKPETFPHRRMGVALATADNIDTARQNAKKAAACIQVIPENILTEQVVHEI
jgi:phosphoribosylglycinamide formyltransferase 2